MSTYEYIQVPHGDKIEITPEGELNTPDRPIIGFIEGDGIGPDIWSAAKHIFDEAIQHCYGEKRSIAWMEIYAGEKAHATCGSYLPEETIDAIRDYHVAIKGPLTTPIGGGFRSLNVSMRQQLDLYACVRPVKHFEGVPSPVRAPEKVDMVIYRENTEDVYAGFEVAQGSDEAAKVIAFTKEAFGWDIHPDSGIGFKPISKTGSERLIRVAIRYALEHGRKSVTIVHKGNIQKFTEGAFRNWGYQLVKDEFPDVAVAYTDCDGEPGDRLLIKDTIADIFLQQILTRPDEFDVIATTNLNGDYISDALAAQVGGIGIAPGANINFETGISLFEATHGTAPKYANQDKVNPSSLVLSGVMMFERLGWNEAADVITSGMLEAFRKKTVTYDFHRLMEEATLLKCSEFANAVVDNFKAS